MRNALLSLTVAGLMLLACDRASAQSLGLDFTGGNSATPIQDQTLGWEFTLNQSMNVTALGMYDVGANGLAQNHFVGIWLPSGGAPLAVATITNSSTVVGSTSSGGNWLFENLGSPLLLGPGNYVLGVDFRNPNTDLIFTGASNVSLDPSITFVQGRFVTTVTAGFDFPDATFGGSFGHFGPNLMLSAVPEPSTWALIGIVAAGTGLYTVRRRMMLKRNLLAR